MSVETTWNPEQSLLARLMAFGEGAPLDVSAAALQARLDWIIRKAAAARGCWNQHEREEARKIEAALDAIGR